MTRCPCLSGLPYPECCEPVHHDHTRAATAEQLMRSRYSAFAVGDVSHLLRTWHASTQPESLELDGGARWYRLDVLDRSDGGPFDDRGTVEFEAFHRSTDGSGSQHEVSRFVREQGRWYYVDGVPGLH